MVWLVRERSPRRCARRPVAGRRLDTAEGGGPSPPERTSRARSSRLGEHLLRKQGVPGSTPGGSTP